MPTVDVAMRASLRRGVGQTMAEFLKQRSVTDDISSTESTFSSWDNCMAKSYCKWPVIVGIIIGSLIVLSVVTCIIRCACCGMSCCCSCFRCLACCGDCCGMCTPRHEKKSKYADAPYSSNQGYQAPAPMIAGGPEAPKFATFETGPNGKAVDPKPIHEDALPPMPSWEQASHRHVLADEKEEGVELGNLNQNGQSMPLMTGASSPAAHSPVGMNGSPFGARPGQGGANGYMPAPSRSPVPQDAYNRNGPRGYGGSQVSGSEYGTNSMYSGETASGYGHDGMQGQGYGQDGYYDEQGHSQGMHGQYGNQAPPQRYGTPSQGGYRGLPPTRQYSNDSNRPYPPNAGFRGPQRMDTPPLQNNSGFDFSGNAAPARNNSGFDLSGNTAPARGYTQSPPLLHTQSFGSTAPPSYASRSPPPQEQSAYPGYRSYPSQQQHDAGAPPPALMPGQGLVQRGGHSAQRSPEPWRPV